MEEWIECEFDEIAGESCPIIAIGDKKLTWEEFGDEVITFEGWTFDFKFSSFYTPSEVDHD